MARPPSKREACCEGPVRIAKLIETVPNRVTLVRLCLLPVLWCLFVLRRPELLAVGLCLAYLTDKLDGFLARVLDQKSRFGDALDSFTDHLLLPSMVIWLVVLRRSAYTINSTLGIVAIGCYLVTIAVGLVKSRRFGGAHLLCAKLLGLVGYMFTIWTLLGGLNPILYGISIGLVFCFSVETCVFHFRPDLFENRLHSLVLGLAKKDVRAPFLRYVL